MKEVKKLTRYIKNKSRISKSRNRFTISDGDLNLIQAIRDIYQRINDSFKESLITSERTFLQSLLLMYSFLKERIKYSQKLLRIFLDFRLNYQQTFYAAKNSGGERNPFLQILIEEFLNATNALLKGSEYEYRDSIVKRGQSYKGVEKWKFYIENISKISVREKDVYNVLSSIDNLIFFDQSQISSFNGKNIFYLVINTHKDIDDDDAEDRILGVNGEVVAINNWLNKHNVRNLITVNPTRAFFITLVEEFRPDKIHYIGHSEVDRLLIRTKQLFYSDDIYNAFNGYMA